MRIVVDLDNTIVDEMARSLRPGILEFLNAIKKEHTLVLWSNSSASRGYEIISRFGLKSIFSQYIFREDYDPRNLGIKKKISLYNADYIIDDDPSEVKFNITEGKKGYIISAYRGHAGDYVTELLRIKADIVDISSNPFYRWIKFIKKMFG